MTDHERRVRAEIRFLKRVITPAQAYRALALHRVNTEQDFGRPSVEPISQVWIEDGDECP